MKNESAYLLKIPDETNEIFKLYSTKLGWNRKQSILKLLFIFKDLLSDLDTGKELVIQIRNEKDKKVITEKVASYDLLRIP